MARWYDSLSKRRNAVPPSGQLRQLVRRLGLFPVLGRAAPRRARPVRLTLCTFEARVVPAVLPLDTADVPVSVTAGVDGGGDVALKADGTGFVVAYQAPDASGGGVYFKRYDANWQVIG